MQIEQKVSKMLVNFLSIQEIIFDNRSFCFIFERNLAAVSNHRMIIEQLYVIFFHYFLSKEYLYTRYDIVYTNKMADKILRYLLLFDLLYERSLITDIHIVISIAL